MEAILEILEVVLPAGTVAVFRRYPEFLEFILGLIAVGLVYLFLARRVWRGGGNGNGREDDGDGNGE